MTTSWLIAPGITLDERQICAAVIKALPAIRGAHSDVMYGYLRFNRQWHLRIWAHTTERTVLIRRTDSAVEIVRKLVTACDLAAELRLAARPGRSWLFRGITKAVTEVELRAAIDRELQHTPSAYWTLSFQRQGYWDLSAADRPEVGRTVLVVATGWGHSSEAIMGKLREGMARHPKFTLVVPPPAKLVGYVPGNRHNYLVEYCQALKEAGYLRGHAKLKIVKWAAQHGDEDRSYIVDMVYPTNAERLEDMAAWDSCMWMLDPHSLQLFTQTDADRAAWKARTFAEHYGGTKWSECLRPYSVREPQLRYKPTLTLRQTVRQLRATFGVWAVLKECWGKR